MKLAVGMLVKNEADRYLAEVIRNICLYADELVILNDNSTDNTMDIIHSECSIPLQTYLVKKGDFGHEIILRKELYNLVVNCRTDWLMIVDADEICSASFGSLRSDFETLMNSNTVDVWGFRFYDFWSKTCYRDDEKWNAHKYYTLMLTRNIQGFTPIWNEVNHHCGRLPMNIWSRTTSGTDKIKIKHYGWATEADRQKKYTRYLQYDPNGKYGDLQKYHSILDPNPHVVPWND